MLTTAETKKEVDRALVHGYKLIEELADFGIEDLKEYHIVEEIKIEDFFTKKEHLKLVLKNG